MYVRKYWGVLVVDDEPDIHAVTKLVLESTDVWGIPLHVRTANNKADAIKQLSEVSGALASDLAVALIDVVMESDTAGLDLCKHIREDLNNRVTELVVRTGQAGKAPERAVIDRYDISGYITKVEATEDRLYTLVKTGVRRFILMRVSQSMRALTNNMIAYFAEHGRKESALLEFLPKALSRISKTADGKPLPGIEGHIAFIIDGQVYGVGEFEDRAHAEKKRAELHAKPANEKGPNGEEVRQYGDHILLSLPAGSRSLEMVARHSFDSVPEILVHPFLDWMTTVRHLLSIAVK